MSLFGRTLDESPSLDSDSESDVDEIQEIPESPEQPEEQHNDDFNDDIYSGEEYDDDDDDDDETSRQKPLLTEKEKKAFRRSNRDEIHLFDAFETTRAGDLGRNLLGAISERRVYVLKRTVGGVATWGARERWICDLEARRAVPAGQWTAWPLRGVEVPGAGERFFGGGERFYGGGGKRRKVFGFSEEFEEVLCDFAVGRARERVEREGRLEGFDDVEDEGGSGGSGEEVSDDESEPEQKKGITEGRTSSPGEDSTLAFSADQDRARTILQPTIRSLMSKVDDLMTGLYHSRMNHRRHRSASHDQNPISSRPKSSSSSEGEKKEALGLRDWSEVLGMASLTGWDPKIVGRAAERCSKLFGEGMTFATLDADETSTKFCEYTPDMVPTFGEGEEEEDEWTLDSLFCPHEGCARYSKKFDLRRRLRWHIKDVHDWDPEVEKRPREVVGGVHLDGFMREIPAQPGWRARDKVKSEKRGGKRKKGAVQDDDDDDDDDDA